MKAILRHWKIFEAAIHNAEMPLEGLGPRRREAIAAVLAIRLGRPLRWNSRSADAPPVEMLLTVDDMYRQKAAERKLRLIAPTRFNPTGEKWLPILHARHDNWHFTALYSNTKLAHDLDKTKDWVIIYHEDESGLEGRCTLVTETHGPLKGKRVVRGRESECAVFHDADKLKQPASSKSGVDSTEDGK